MVGDAAVHGDGSTSCDLVTVHLGELHGTVLLYGGVYSNGDAADALMDRADEMGIPRENRICTGDVCAYCAEPSRSVSIVRTRGGPVLAGNCEKQLALGAKDCGCGFEETSTCSLLSRTWYAHAQRSLSDDELKWMGSLPDRIVFGHNGKTYALIHGGASDISRFLWPVTDRAVLNEEAAILRNQVGPFDAVVAGHCGYAFATDDSSWINAGAIGMPQNDGESATRFMTIDGSSGNVCCHRLAYDYESQIKKMKAAGLQQGYHTALRTGNWPSEDVLPECMKSKRAAGSRARAPPAHRPLPRHPWRYCWLILVICASLLLLFVNWYLGFEPIGPGLGREQL